MSTEPLENLYFNWLCNAVNNVKVPTPSLTYYNLLRTLHKTEFIWLVAGDDNRAEDGVELRIQFLILGDIPDDPEWRSIGCSLLEMLIAFSRRAEFMTDSSSYFWFWHFIRNLNLYDYNDSVDYDEYEVMDILNRFISREYEPEGYGSILPIPESSRDQANVELWYQFCQYISEVEFDDYSM